jgi:exonuclease VII large subunit
MDETTQILPQTKSPEQVQMVYTPSEIIGIFNGILAKQNEYAKVVYLHGVFLATSRQSYSGIYYDTLRDENSQEELTIRITQAQRENLKNGNLVNVGGILNRSVSTKGLIQINLNVSRIEVVQEQIIDETEIKRMELRQKKAAAGFKNVDALLENLLFIGDRPKVALIFAQSSITDKDFQAGINAAKVSIDFYEFRVNFSNTSELISELTRLDGQGFYILAIIRGGGSGIERLDDIELLSTVVNLKTPIIGAIGHVEERLFIKQLVDKTAPTPNGLGQYFSEMVETVNDKKTKSRAALTEQIKKQFEEQLATGRKQNEELQKKLGTLTKNQETESNRHREQVAKAHEQNEKLQKQLSEIQTTHKTEMAKLTEAQNKLQSQLTSQSDQFDKRLKEMQKSNKTLQTNLSQITAQNAESQRQLSAAQDQAISLQRQLAEASSNKGNNSIWIWVAIIAIILFIVSLITR